MNARLPTSPPAGLSATTTRERVTSSTHDTSGPDTRVHEGPALRFVHPWRSLRGLIVFAVALSTGITWWPFIVTGRMPWYGVVVFGGSSLVMLWGGLAYLLNKTTIEIGRGMLTVRHGPIPSMKSRELELSKVQQCYIITRTRKADKGIGTIPIYDVIVENRDGGDFPLVKGLEDRERALSLERRIEEHLGIEEKTHERPA